RHHDPGWRACRVEQKKLTSVRFVYGRNPLRASREIYRLSDFLAGVAVQHAQPRFVTGVENKPAGRNRNTGFLEDVPTQFAGKICERRHWLESVPQKGHNPITSSPRKSPVQAWPGGCALHVGSVTALTILREYRAANSSWILRSTASSGYCRSTTRSAAMTDV